jgi:hypothetical protein
VFGEVKKDKPDKLIDHKGSQYECKPITLDNFGSDEFVFGYGNRSLSGGSYLDQLTILSQATENEQTIENSDNATDSIVDVDISGKNFEFLEIKRDNFDLTSILNFLPQDCKEIVKSKKINLKH